jgi:hypothetical protein
VFRIPFLVSGLAVYNISLVLYELELLGNTASFGATFSNLANVSILSESFSGIASITVHAFFTASNRPSNACALPGAVPITEEYAEMLFSI